MILSQVFTVQEEDFTELLNHTAIAAVLEQRRKKTFALKQAMMQELLTVWMRLV